MTIAVDRFGPGIGRSFQIAAIGDVQAERAQRFGESGDAQRFGSQARAAVARTDVGRCADQRYGRLTGAHVWSL
ncbi:hypothetical protein D3C71_1751810 [compost metagenome]